LLDISKEDADQKCTPLFIGFTIDELNNYIARKSSQSEQIENNQNTTMTNKNVKQAKSLLKKQNNTINQAESNDIQSDLVLQSQNGSSEPSTVTAQPQISEISANGRNENNNDSESYLNHTKEQDKHITLVNDEESDSDISDSEQEPLRYEQEDNTPKAGDFCLKLNKSPFFTPSQTPAQSKLPTLTSYQTKLNFNSTGQLGNNSKIVVTARNLSFTHESNSANIQSDVNLTTNRNTANGSNNEILLSRGSTSYSGGAMEVDEVVAPSPEEFNRDKFLKNLESMKESIREKVCNQSYVDLSFSERIKYLGRDMYLEYLELAYTKKSNSLNIKSQQRLQLDDIGTNINERRDEIHKWTGVKITGCRVLEDMITKEIILKVTVENYTDYKILLANWGPKAFKKGVAATRAPMEEALLIENVNNKADFNINCSKNIETIKALESVGLFNVTRDSYEKLDQTTKQMVTVLKHTLKCNPVTMLNILEATHHSVLLDMTSLQHKVIPETERINTCNNCGKFNSHNARNCPEPAICTRCLSQHHIIEDCDNQRGLKCINCGDRHSCNLKSCSSLVGETRKQNPFIFNLLIGEKVRNNEYEVLGITNYNMSMNVREVKDNSNLNNEQITEVVLDIVSQHQDSVNSKLNKNTSVIQALNKTVISLQSKTEMHETRLNLHEERLNKQDEIIKEIGKSFTTLASSMTSSDKKIDKVQNDVSGIAASNAVIAGSLLQFKAEMQSFFSKINN